MIPAPAKDGEGGGGPVVIPGNNMKAVELILNMTCNLMLILPIAK